MIKIKTSDVLANMVKKLISDVLKCLRSNLILSLALFYPLSIFLYIVANILNIYIISPDEDHTFIDHKEIQKLSNALNFSVTYSLQSFDFHQSSMQFDDTLLKVDLWRHARDVKISREIPRLSYLEPALPSVSVQAFKYDPPIKEFVFLNLNPSQNNVFLKNATKSKIKEKIGNLSILRPRPRPITQDDETQLDQSANQNDIISSAPTKSLKPRPRPKTQDDETQLDQSANQNDIISSAPTKSLKPRLKPASLTGRNDKFIKNYLLNDEEEPKINKSIASNEGVQLSRPITNICKNIALTKEIPKRKVNALSGSEILKKASTLSENIILDEIINGNIPDSNRTLHPIKFTKKSSNETIEITICVTGNYLSLGSETDNVIVPLGLPQARQVAQKFKMILPTTKMVDAIYDVADVRLKPVTMSPGPQMTSVPYIVEHDKLLKDQLKKYQNAEKKLIAGHKKDLVITNRLAKNFHRVAIYGWHKNASTPIQPLSTVHDENYADYSHGVRLISSTAFINGKKISILDLLLDPKFATLINNGGALNIKVTNLIAD